MSINSLQIIGVVLTTINGIILVLLAWNIHKCYQAATNIKKAINKRDVDFYFMQLFSSMLFFLANSIALYTGIQAYILHPYDELNAYVLWRIADRTGMLSVAITLIWNRRKYNPFENI